MHFNFNQDALVGIMVSKAVINGKISIAHKTFEKRKYCLMQSNSATDMLSLRFNIKRVWVNTGLINVFKGAANVPSEYKGCL